MVAPLTHGRAHWAPLGYVQLTSLSSATALSPPLDATIVEVVVETANIRYRDDGTAPTASVGMLVTAGSSFQYAGDLTAIQFIQVSSGAVLDISYYK